jgi:hypothetical protein
MDGVFRHASPSILRRIAQGSVVCRIFLLLLGINILCSAAVASATLEVGPGKPFQRIEEANAQANAGDVILVHPRRDGRPYDRVAVFVRRKNLTFRAAATEDGQRVKLSGKDFNYTGIGNTPRAIFQFNRGADGCTIDGFELTGAHNRSHNGAGVRINQANRIFIRNCSIHGNDMGVMSNGDGTAETAVGQRIEFCEIHHNGDPAEPGFNHNLYLGGTDATIRFCEVHSSLTGHNLKSRAHVTRVEYCYLHDSANRELDLVDAADTERPGSDAVVIGCILVKDPHCPGNRAVIHFGRDGGKPHDGTLYLIFNTVVTPFIAPVVQLSDPQAKVFLEGNLVSDGESGQNRQTLVEARNGASLQSASGTHNWFSGAFGSAEGTALEPRTNLFRRAEFRLFVDPAKHNYRLTPQAARMAETPLSAETLNLPSPHDKTLKPEERPLAWQYRHPAGKEKRPAERDLTLGAYAGKKETTTER